MRTTTTPPEKKVTPPAKKIRRDPPVIGGPDAPRIGILTLEQIDRSMFG